MSVHEDGGSKPIGLLHAAWIVSTARIPGETVQRRDGLSESIETHANDQTNGRSGPKNSASLQRRENGEGNTAVSV